VHAYHPPVLADLKSVNTAKRCGNQSKTRA
jgi:hypothetical protein